MVWLSARWALAWLSFGTLAAAVCSCDASGDGSEFSGSGAGSTESAGSGANSGTGGLNPSGSGGGSAGGGGQCTSELTGIIRDFSDASHPDFEYTLGDDRGIPQSIIGSDMKPVYAGMPTTPTTNGQGPFDQWFRDTDGINIPIALSIPLTQNGTVFTYDNGDFFPIDDQGFGNEGRGHNYHFTYEIHAEFTYEGGEVFTFTGDDDLFTFVNGVLALDLGGVHGAETASVDLDAEAGNLGIQVGSTYTLDFFFAERHTTESNFRIDTSIACFNSVEPPQ